MVNNTEQVNTCKSSDFSFILYYDTNVTSQRNKFKSPILARNRNELIVICNFNMPYSSFIKLRY